AAAAVSEVRANYEGHCRAARELAEAHFGSDVVLERLITDAAPAGSASRESAAARVSTDRA
ncbi:MAG: hypothetical protein ACT443_06365, partial [Gemmatimonadota bacterium]